MSPKSKASTITRRDITSLSVPETGCKKLVVVLATSTLVTKARKKAAVSVKTARAGKDGNESKGRNLVRVPYIRYPIIFWKKSVSVSALFDSGSEINAIYLIFAKKLGFFIRRINIGVQKIDGTMLDTYKIVVAALLVTNKANEIRFFKETFLVANVSLEVVFGMPFLILNSANVNFLD